MMHRASEWMGHWQGGGTPVVVVLALVIIGMLAFLIGRRSKR